MAIKSPELEKLWLPGRRELLTHFARLGAAAASLSLLSGCLDEAAQPEASGPGKRPNMEPGPSYLRFGVNRIPPGQTTDFTAGRHKGYLHHAEGDEWIALSSRCTHSGCRVSFQRDIQGYKCPCHGSAFDARGIPLNGPAKLPLRRYQTHVEGDAVIITFSEYVAPTEQQPAPAQAPVPEDRSKRPPLPDFSRQSEGSR